jgi:hypothetical protein
MWKKYIKYLGHFSSAEKPKPLLALEEGKDRSPCQKCREKVEEKIAEVSIRL